MFLEFVHRSIEAIEGLAILIVVLVVLFATLRFVYFLIVQRARISESYESYKGTVAKAMLLALELLVAADIIFTVVVEPTLASAAALVLLVIVRTFLSWSLVVETEGHWPWHAARRGDEQSAK
jgi:uncharacterized membrane protein